MHSHESYQAAIGLVSLNSNSETHMTAICDARLIYGGGDFTGIYLLWDFNGYFFSGNVDKNADSVCVCVSGVGW